MNKKIILNCFSKKHVSLLVVFLIFVSFTSAFALTETERVTVSEPSLENTFGTPIFDNINVNHQIQISTDIKNNQNKSQNFIYFVQIKNNEGYVISLGWISGQLAPNHQLNPSLSWTPIESGEFVAEIYVWEGLKNHKALSDFTILPIQVS
jgi:hypothetical protein